MRNIIAKYAIASGLQSLLQQKRQWEEKLKIAIDKPQESTKVCLPEKLKNISVNHSTAILCLLPFHNNIVIDHKCICLYFNTIHHVIRCTNSLFK